MAQAEYNKDNHVENLPDAYAKKNDSNNYKILEVERCAVNDLRTTFQQIFDYLDINNAKGKTLDFYGEKVGQARGVATDEQYILMIKACIMRNLSNGSYQSIVNGLCTTFNCEPSQVFIAEAETACVVQAVTLPLNVIEKAGLTVSQAMEIVKKMLPVGVKLETFLFEGTFEFAFEEGESDENTGFCDVEGGTIGGYLGILTGGENEPVLPI